MFIINWGEIVGRLDPVLLAEIKNNALVYKYSSQPLKSLVKSFSGGTPSKENSELWNGDVYWASPKDFKDFYIKKTEDSITELGVKNSATKVAPKGSVFVVVRSGILQHTIPVAINTVPMAINQDVKVLAPNSNILPEYLGYFFIVFNNRILPRVVKHSTTVQSINSFEFEHLPIPIPSEAAQKQIIKIMDDAYEEKRQKEQQAKDLLDSINSYLLDELGIIMPPEEENTLENRMFCVGSGEVLGGRFDPFFWKPYYKIQKKNICNSMHPKLKLSDVATFETGVVYSADRERDSGHGILRANNILLPNNIIDLSEIRYIDETLTLQDSKRLYANDIFMCSASGSKEHAGKVAFVERDLPYYFGGFMAAIRVFDSACTPKYLFEYLASSIFRNSLFRLLGGTNINNVTGSMLNRIPIVLPTVHMQEIIVLYISQTRYKAQELEQQAQYVIQNAKEQVEKILLEGSL